MAESLDDTERAAHQHRDRASRALSSLMNTLAPERLGPSAAEEAARLSQTMLQKVVKQAQNNPAGFALIGLGAALIAVDGSKPNAQSEQNSNAERITKAGARRHDTGWMRSGGSAINASALRRSLIAALDQLPETARDRVVAARLKAIEAQEALDQNLRSANTKARAIHKDQPLLTAALVAGVGALIGALLPTSRTETKLLSARRDQLVRAAQAGLAAELTKLGAEAYKVVTTARSEFEAPNVEPAE